MTDECRCSVLGAVCRPLLFYALLLAVLPYGALAAEGLPERMVVATYNLENYTSTGRMTPDGYRTDYPKPEQAKRALHQVILSMKADLLVFEEIGGKGHLEELRRDLAALGCDYAHAVVLEAADKERRVGALSRYPFLRVVPHAQIDFPYLTGRGVSKRGLLEIVVATQAGPLTIWGLHLKSRFSTGSEDPGSEILRGAEAAALRDIVLGRHPDPQGFQRHQEKQAPACLSGTGQDPHLGASRRRRLTQGVLDSLLPPDGQLRQGGSHAGLTGSGAPASSGGGRWTSPRSHHGHARDPDCQRPPPPGAGARPQGCPRKRFQIIDSKSAP